MKRNFAFLIAAMFLVACVSLYLMMESVSPGSQDGSYNDGMSLIEMKIHRIEDDLKKNQQTINMIKDTVKHFVKDGNQKHLDELHRILDNIEKSQDTNVRKEMDIGARLSGILHYNMSDMRTLNLLDSQEMCGFSERVLPKLEVQMNDIYDKLSFDNPDGGVWKQGFPISYNVKQFEGLPLQVFVVPHSHCDPGWLKTFERYYTDQTRHILNNMIDKLEQYPKMKFIYAEMSFFSLWWNDIDEGRKQRVKKLLSENRLEIVTGGWVMNDEANSHYFAMVDQIIEGNQWLLNQLGVKPQSGWAIDPFGHSPTMAYILNKAGFKQMLIQRTHYSVKKYFAQEKALEFMWRQFWDSGGSSDILCHMMPFYSYDVPHTCGPEPAVCCQFDFKRLPGGKISCPWKIPPQPITDNNVAQKAEQLLDQYRKKSQLYRSNVVLIPLGDDFRYEEPIEWDQQYVNYQKLFDYMNSHAEWNVQAQFGTLSDYFSALRKRTGSEQGGRPDKYPVVSGDFFTYADRDEHYWSGYFTSRPYYKRMDRQLEAHLRGGEVLFSQALLHARQYSTSTFPVKMMMENLVSARRSLGLYQHHDGVTGTAKDFVMTDYGTKMMNAISDMKDVIRLSAQYLLTKDKVSYKHDTSSVLFNVDEQQMAYDSLPDKTVLTVSDQPRSVLFYNSLAHTRTILAQVLVSHPHVKVTDSDGHVLKSQVNPVWEDSERFSEDKFQLVFVVTVPALGLSTYNVAQVAAGANPDNMLADVTVYNTADGMSPHSNQYFQVLGNSGSSVYIENTDLKIHISTTSGTLKSVLLRETGDLVNTDVQFVTYGVTSGKEKSGAYLFLPDGPAKNIVYESPYMRVVRGHLLNMVKSVLPNVEHDISLHNSPGIDGFSIDIKNIVDIRPNHNQELAMRVIADVKNKDKIFHTDLNGFQIQKRKTYSKLPLQANFYPMPTMMFIEDEKIRVSVLSGQSLGCASLEQGWLEVMQDRRLNQDDNRGLQQGVLDNKLTVNTFKLLLERNVSGKQVMDDQVMGYPSIASHHASFDLLHPVMVMPQGTSSSHTLHATHRPLSVDLPCDVHLVNLRTLQYPEHDQIQRFLPKNEIGLILHRVGVACQFSAKSMHCALNNGQVSLVNFLKNLTVTSVQHSSLSFTSDLESVDPSSSISLPIMELQSYKLTFQ